MSEIINVQVKTNESDVTGATSYICHVHRVNL